MRECDESLESTIYSFCAYRFLLVFHLKLKLRT